MQESSESHAEQVSGARTVDFRRNAARAIFCVAVTAILLDIIPPTWPWFSQPKLWLSNVLNRVGLWQGQWTMFAPDPVLANASLWAEFEDEEGKTAYWDSPDWKYAGTFEKFYRFRYLNFYNRIHLDRNARALKDFSDFLASNESESPVVRLMIFRYSMTILAPEVGSMPNQNDAIWVSRSDFLTERRYDP